VKSRFAYASGGISTQFEVARTGPLNAANSLGL